MATLNPYLIFNGNCEEAFLFYKSVFGGEFPYVGKFKDMPPADGKTSNSEDAERIMHISLTINGGSILMGSDSTSRSGDVVLGANISLSLNATSRTEAATLFNGLSEDGNVIMPMENTFWGAYFGMFVDKFGIHWMVNFDEPDQK